MDMCGDLKEIEKFWSTESQQRNSEGGDVNSVSVAAGRECEFAV